jgi:hypothetical protein
MIRKAWLRQLEKLERAKSLGKSQPESEAEASRVSVVIDEHVRLEFSPEPRRVSVTPRQGAAGGTQRGPMVLNVEIW